MHRFFGRLWRKRIDWEIVPGSAATGPDPAEKVETRLLTILEMVNEWLQFAEAKNAGLVALDALGLAAIMTILPSAEVPEPVAWGLGAASMLLLVSLGVSLWSFLPRDNLGKVRAAARRQPRATDNLYFYGDVCGYQPAQLAAAIARRYDKIGDYDASQHLSHVDLASQVIANARIAVAKNRCFKLATWIALLALVASAAGIGAAVAIGS